MKKPTLLAKLIWVLCCFIAINTFAQNYVPFTPRFDQDVRGDIVLIGNNILGPDNNAFNDNTVYNHNVDMRYIDIDGDPTTFSSSSADLEIPNPNCYQIIYAGLYWGAVNPGTEPITEVKFRGPVGGYNDIQGTIIFDANGTTVDGGDSFSYACFADVTDIVTNLGTDLGTYTVANVSSAEGETATFTPFNGTGQSAGWSLFVVYEDPTFTGKSITSFDGFSAISVPGNNPNLDIPVDGFRTIPAPAPVRANFAFATLEGDSPILGDRLRLNGVSLSTTDRPVANFFNSSVTQLSALPVNNRVPNSTNTLGFDTGIIAVPNPSNSVIANDATSAIIRLETSGDTYFPYFFAFSVEIIEPDIVLTKIVEDDAGNNIGGQVVGLNQPLNYVIGFQNIGNDNATNFQIRDILPINIIYNHPTDLVLPPGVTVSSYNPVTRELIFDIDDSLVEENDPVYEIRIEVQTVETCQQLADACSNIINNQAFATYNGFFNPTFLVTDDPSLNDNTGCLFSPQATNFLADLDDCIFSEEIVLCGSTVDITAANGYDSYSWSTSPSGSPVIGTTQTITVSNTGTYYSFNTATAPCQSIVQEFVVDLFGGTIPNPVIPYADEVVVCPNDGKELPNIYLCGANDSRYIETNISGVDSIIWEQLDENSCPPVSNTDCANEDSSCNWNQVASGPNYLADSAGQFRLTINYEGGCFVQFYFNVYQNILNPSVIANDIICTTPGSIIVNDVPSGYEYSLDGVNYQSSNVFSISTPGTYTIYIRQIGVSTNPCIFTVPDVQIRARDFTVTTVVQQPLCFGDLGSIQLSANDVEPQYTFTISEGGTIVNTVGPVIENTYVFDNLNVGLYTATVETEDGCIYTEDILISEPPELTVTAAITNPLTCDPGEITIYPQGGTPPYFYFINSTTDFQTVPEVPVSTAGMYDITVIDSNNCSAETSIIVEEVLPPDYSISNTNIDCPSNTNTGSITINISNFNGNTVVYSIDNGATYQNSNVFNGLIAGNYDVMLQYTFGNSVCTTSPVPVTITESTPISGTVDVSSPLTCTNLGTITISNVTGGIPPYTYSIDGVNYQSGNTFSGLNEGTYTVTVQDGTGCYSSLDNITINPLQPPTDLEFNHAPIDCSTNVTTLTISNVIGGTSPLQYQIIAPTTATTPLQSAPDFMNLAPGTYTIEVTDANNCTYVESYTIPPLPVTSVSVNLSSGLDCTANPDAVINGIINGPAPFVYAVSINNGTYTSLGTTGATFTYSTSSSGTYQFQITDGNGCVIESTPIIVNPISLPVIDSVIQGQDILCNGDSSGSLDITIDPNSGTPPFAINIYNNTTGTDYGTQNTSLPSGNYTITVTDSNSCQDTETITILEPDPITVNYSSVDITCTLTGVSQGSVIVDSVTGGTAPYNYFVTGSNGYSNSEFNTAGTTSVSFDVVDFGLYEINVIDANGCSVLVQDVLVASPPSDLDISVTPSVSCSTGGEAIVGVSSSLSSTGPFFFSIYQGPSSVYPNPPGTWIPEDAPSSATATFTGLIPGVLYTFIVYDQSTNCSYYEPSTIPIPTNSTLTVNATDVSNVSCTGNADGDVSFTINSIYSIPVSVDFEIFDSLSLQTTGITGTGTVPGNGTLDVSNLGPLTPGNYFVSVTETSGPNAGCGVVTTPFNITESIFPLDLSVQTVSNANCNPNSGIISAVAQNGTAPYQFQITTTATTPSPADTNWNSNSTFNVDSGTYYVHLIDAYNCIVTSPATIVDQDPLPIIDVSLNNSCLDIDGTYQIDVSLANPGIPPYAVSINGGSFQTQSFPFTISNVFSGTHTIEVVDANGCNNIVSLDVFSPITVNAQVDSQPSCNNDDGEIEVSPSGGSGNYAFAISPSFPSITIAGNIISGVPSGLYIITTTDTTTGCTEDVTINVPEAVIPDISLTPNSLTCFGDNSGELVMEILNYSGAYTYEVSDSSGTSITGIIATNTAINPLIISNLPSGLLTVEIIETDFPFCSNSSNVLIQSPPDPLNLSVTETSNVTCTNNLGTITAEANGGWGGHEYELLGPISVPYSNNGIFSNLSDGTYTVNVRDAEGCIASETITLNLPIPITATFAANQSSLACYGDTNGSITVSNVSGGQGNNYSYTLNTLAPIPSISGPQTSNIFQNLGAGTYSITISDGFNCELNSIDIIITEPSPMQVDLVRTTSQTCLFESTLTLSSSGGTGPYQYSSDSTFNNILGTFNSEVTFNVPEGSYSYYVRDANNCISNISNEITIDPLPDLTVELESNNLFINCTGDNTGSIIASAFGGLGNYTYTLQDNSGNPINATELSPGHFIELVAGDYFVFVESGDCEALSAPISITEPSSNLDANIIVSNVTCAGNNNGVIEINASGGTGIIKYAISPQLNQFFDTNIFENLSPDDYQIIVQDELGCFLLFDVTVEEPPQVLLNIVPNSILPEVCFGDNDGEFSIEISGGTMPYSVSLDDYNGVYTTGTANQTQFDFVGLNGGDHIVFVRDSEGCESEWNITFPESVDIIPEVVIEYGCDANAQNNIITVNIEDTGLDTTELDYALNSGPYQMSNVFTNVTPNVNHTISVRHTNGCIVTTETFEVGTYTPVTLSLSQGNLNEIVASANGGTGEYTFTFNGINVGDETTYEINATGIYVVTVEDTNGCFAEAQIQMEFIEICIPNYFTPNGDGVTDTWSPGCVSNYPDLEFDIFDRYGRKVASYRVGEYWDGRYNGNELPTGDYWYVVRPNGDTVDREFVGHFTLYR